MTLTKLLVAVAACLVLCLVMGVAIPPAFAQDDDFSGDKNLASRQGIKGSLQTNAKKDEGDSKGPTKLQMAVGVGSIFVMIAVVKWL